jgi:hypothetical protein
LACFRHLMPTNIISLNIGCKNMMHSLERSVS